METNKMYEAAKEYIAKGFSVIPTYRDKTPIVGWKEYQQRQATDEELQNWFIGTDVNIAIVTGALSGVTVLDLDSQESVDYVKEHGIGDPAIVKTHRGHHLYYKYQVGDRNFQKRSELPNIDLRGEGGYVIAPPSIHADGST